MECNDLYSSFSGTTNKDHSLFLDNAALNLEMFESDPYDNRFVEQWEPKENFSPDSTSTVFTQNKHDLTNTDPVI